MQSTLTVPSTRTTRCQRANPVRRCIVDAIYSRGINTVIFVYDRLSVDTATPSLSSALPLVVDALERLTCADSFATLNGQRVVNEHLNLSCPCVYILAAGAIACGLVERGSRIRHV